MGNKKITFKKKGPVGWIVLSYPATGEFVDIVLADTLREICSIMSYDDSIRVILITCEKDLLSLSPCPSPIPAHQFDSKKSSRSHDAILPHFQLANSIASLEKPTIIAINGDAKGQGLELALASDIRIGTTLSRFSMPHIQYGQIPWDGGTQRLPRIIGFSRALELLMTGREVDAQEAKQTGLVHQLVEEDFLLQQASGLALTITSQAPVAVRYTKELLLKGMDLNLDSGLRLEADLNIILQSTTDRSEGITSFLERRDPNFQGQ
ncbi:enoyl-CoA hydratase/isomerase family protein [SAR202 cluster bacterium AD-802-E10_MRT_200m]|nr:enoyl-CoA hydratase/isomerase family protein [SAR202 cluster bacterium AD-802-E10_MRT_200m]